MKIHNLLEDIVNRKTREILDDRQIITEYEICTCDQCRLDIVCYALNRLKPRYVVSGKGAAHLETEFSENIQSQTDIVSVINDALKTVSKTKRPGCSLSLTPTAESGPVYNFPSITGRVFHGETFEPISNREISLLLNGKPVEMMNSNWSNPYYISDSTPGTFNFWPSGIPATSDEPRNFQFEIRLKDRKSEDQSFHFSLELHPESGIKDVFDLDSAFRVDDVYVFEN